MGTGCTKTARKKVLETIGFCHINVFDPMRWTKGWAPPEDFLTFSLWPEFPQSHETNPKTLPCPCKRAKL